MLKNVTLLVPKKNSALPYRLLDPDGRPISAFDIYAKILKRRPFNTRKSYLRGLAEFFDFLFEAAGCSPDGSAISYDELIEIIEAYDDYLVLGEESCNPIARRVSQMMPSPRISKASSATKHAAVRKFLRLSERIRLQMLELTNAGFHLADVSQQSLITSLGASREPNAYQQQAIVRNSMLEGCISRGSQLLKEAILPTSIPEITYEHERAFPYDRVRDVLSQMTTYRDKALYALCAASGSRVSEALQLLWEDVDAVAQTVRLIDPKSRPHSASYLALQPVERDRLVWKGRATQFTLMIDPFATMFFEALANYLRHEYIPHGRHKFIFQYGRLSDEGGRPYFLASASSRNGVLNRAISLAGVTGVKGPHSFRHMYGTYLLNYFPRPNGTFGLPMGIVQKLMGHKHIKDTAKYARHDRDLLETELRYANIALYGNGDFKSLNELKRDALLIKLNQVEKQLADELLQTKR